MTNSGRWSQQQVFKNCGKSDCQSGCADDIANKPHGPYTQLRRRNPAETGQQDAVYLGKVVLTNEQLAIINEQYSDAYVPSKQEILAALK